MLDSHPNIDRDDLETEQTSVDLARRYLTRTSHGLDESTKRLMLRYLDERQVHINRVKNRLNHT